MSLKNIVEKAQRALAAKHGSGMEIISIEWIDRIPDNALWTDSKSRELHNQRMRENSTKPHWMVVYTDESNEERWVLRLTPEGIIQE